MEGRALLGVARAALRFVSRIFYGLFEYNALMCERTEKICGEDIDHSCHFLADSDDTPFSLLYRMRLKGNINRGHCSAILLQVDGC